jgi:hypothetical protein
MDSGSGWGQVEGSCEQGNEPLRFHEMMANGSLSVVCINKQLLFVLVFDKIRGKHLSLNRNQGQTMLRM